MDERLARYGLNTRAPADREYLIGGWIGLISYEFGYAREPRLWPLCPGLPVPLLSAGLYLWAASRHSATGRFWLWVHPACGAPVRQQLAGLVGAGLNEGSDEFHLTPEAAQGFGDDARLGSDESVHLTPEGARGFRDGAKLGSDESIHLTPEGARGFGDGAGLGSDERLHLTPGVWQMLRPFRPCQSREEVEAGVQAIRRYIAAGDCYQTNLSQAFTGVFSGSPWSAFRALSESHATPYSAFLRVPGGEVLSLSPERFLRVQNGVAETSPIKGTRPRGGSPEQDRAMAEALQNSEKDRAENLMIVDLLRNDLGRRAAPGSVSVDRLFALESFPNVHHLVSHIRATLADGVSPLQLLFDAFPGGSITGAPKIRAMEIIRELEPHWRGPYCGSVFHYGLDGSLDSSIAIRTLLCETEGSENTVHCWGGGGIVADSVPGEEYEEMLTKVGGLMRFLDRFEG
ncbi:anthranilate synthase component I family protein [Marinobacter sp. C2H3]|uniref:anthranilate synthase component I family protein n=1 Tax=Marinobacter sp. C2H3 TaxID=3119003 RepID=UPI003FA5B9A3